MGNDFANLDLSGPGLTTYDAGELQSMLDGGAGLH